MNDFADRDAQRCWSDRVLEYWGVGNTINQGINFERFLHYSRCLSYEEKTSKVFEGDSSKSGRQIFYS